jgi:magnesium transporter
MLSTVLEANMAVLSVKQARSSNRQNATMEQLTILATIFLPLTSVTGFLGQNFGWLTGHITPFATFVICGIGGLIVPLILLLTWLRHRRADTGTGT